MLALVLPHCDIEMEQSMVTEDSVCSMDVSEFNDSTEFYGIFELKTFTIDSLQIYFILIFNLNIF